MGAGLPSVAFLAGPTACGKTGLGIGVARALGAEIVSADSMLVYRHLDIGTAKPTALERLQVPHHLVDVVDPDGHYDAARFREDALGALEGIARRGRPAIVVGGTGLYLRALRYGLAAAPPADGEFRERIEREAGEMGTAALHARLAEVDPITAEAVHPNDLVRIQRALEIMHATGRPASEVRAEHGFRRPEIDVLYLVVDVPAAGIRRRIEERAAFMIRAGLVDEVRRVLAMGYGPDLAPLRGLNYRHAIRHIEGGIGQDEMLERMITDTWHFARRQRRWFAGEPDVRLVPPDPAAILEVIRMFFLPK